MAAATGPRPILDRDLQGERPAVPTGGRWPAEQVPSPVAPIPSADPGAHVTVLAPPPVADPAIRDDDALLRAHARTRDRALQRRLVERYMPLARYAAAKFRHSSEPFDDLVQVASIGLLKAIQRFDPDNGASFSSYALPTMMGELRRHFRDRGWVVRPPRDLQEDALRVEKATQALHAELGVAPTIAAIAERCGLTDEAVLEARQALEGRNATSLSSGGGADDDDHHLGLEATLGAIDDGFTAAEQRATIARLTSVLTRREREIVRLRFEEDLTQSEIGDLVGLSQMHVSRLLRIALEKLHVAAAGGGSACRA
jgi:RNA polymerase sigma-B factor